MKNVKLLFAFRFTFMFLVLIPVIVPFFMGLGLSMEQVFQLQAWFGFIVVLFEVPTGYVSDLWSRKGSLILGTIISAVGFTWLLWAENFLDLIFFETSVGIGISLVSGSDVSLLYDSLPKEKKDLGPQFLGKLQSYSVFGEATASVIGGLLAIKSLHAVVWGSAVASWIPLLFLFGVKEPVVARMDSTSHYQNFKKIFKFIFLSEDKMVRLVFVNLVVWGLSTFFAVWLLQRYWEIQEVSYLHFGYLWAAGNFLVGVVSRQVHWLEEKYGAIPLIFVLGLAPVAGYFGMAFFAGYLGIAFGYLFSVGRGVTQVLLKDALNWRVPSEFRATANSLVSLGFRLVFAVTGPGVGYLIDHQGMDTALTTVGGIFLILFFITLVPLIRQVRLKTKGVIPTGSEVGG